MPPFFSNKRLIVLLVCIVILVGLIGYSMSERRSMTWPEQFIVDSVGWVQSVFSQPAHMVAGFFDTIEDIRNVYEENQALKAQLDDYATVSVEVDELRRQNDQLKESLDITESLYDASYRSAAVINRSPDRWNEFIGINKGAQNGIEEDMSVITSEGLVGKVARVSQFTSTVQLLTDQDRANRISAMASEDDSVYGFIEGIDEDTGYLHFTKIETDMEVEEGMTVVTSGLGGVFPRGLEIGEVIGVKDDEFGLTQSAYVEPAANFHHLDYVMVVERESQSLEPDIDPDLGDDDE
ncbi:rod shape-determining protein MreC [Texcoconibacillus texcoconensis]|uniref:Cell shape-determining protein MreC n=1 Tax=Texcoconibacillus texcoconensis TaxID=1095777 RepID=A0A840QSA0_9BACI|nr:rod shape-determining protein MreC [Texcoconibacillus texcoconensis]MBB5174386.1 rod shape-determining protein MreC [Texcoconibacillus texcoconensis]